LRLFISLLWNPGWELWTGWRSRRPIDQELDVSSLVTDIGGLALYPAMMPESNSLPWVASTGAHEWTHHYLTLRPLGILYDSDAQLRTMNETVANIVGKEIADQVIQRYYPELAPADLPRAGSC
jgi:hypothetical protein